jgi:integrase
MPDIDHARNRAESALNALSRDQGEHSPAYAELDANPPEPVDVYPVGRRGKTTVAAYAPGWLDGQELLETNSVEIAKSARKRIMPHLGGKAREDVAPDDVRRMLAALKRSGLSDGTVSRTLDVARQLLPKAATDGVRYRIKERRRMKAAPCGLHDGGQVGRNRRHPWDRRRAARIRLRGEHPADDRGSRNDVHRARLRQDGDGYAGHLGYRRSRHGAGGVREGSVLTGPRGGYLKRSTFRRVFWLPAIEKAGMPGMRVHDMRHSAISWWVAAHIPLADVRDRAGHSSIAVANTYVHAVPTGDDPFLAILGEAA